MESLAHGNHLFVYDESANRESLALERPAYSAKTRVPGIVRFQAYQ